MSSLLLKSSEQQRRQESKRKLRGRAHKSKLRLRLTDYDDTTASTTLHHHHHQHHCHQHLQQHFFQIVFLFFVYLHMFPLHLGLPQPYINSPHLFILPFFCNVMQQKPNIMTPCRQASASASLLLAATGVWYYLLSIAFVFPSFRVINTLILNRFPIFLFFKFNTLNVKKDQCFKKQFHNKLLNKGGYGS